MLMFVNFIIDVMPDYSSIMDNSSQTSFISILISITFPAPGQSHAYFELPLENGARFT